MRCIIDMPVSNKSCFLLFRRLCLCLITFVICFSAVHTIAESGFVNDAEAINRVAKSVLMLEVFDKEGKIIATGSGFVAFNNSTLVTNYHVIEDGVYIFAATDDGEYYEVKQVLCSNMEIDIAVLAFESVTDISPLSLYCGDDLLRGESVVAIGSPIGITNTVSKGNISALYTEDNVPWIQFTAPISQGSSGGVLLNDEGAVIGITSAVYANTQNINLAIRAIAAQAMYNSWDGNTHDFPDSPKNSKVDYNTIKADTDIAKGIDLLSESAQWTCPDCSNINTLIFCQKCGKARPEWVCKCGQENLYSFCGRCGNSVDSLINEFNNAYQALSEGNYKMAADVFSNLALFDSRTYSTLIGIYSNAANQINNCYYMWGKQFLSEGRYTDAVSQFLSAGSDYLDSGEKVGEAYYLYAEELLKDGLYEDASIAFTNAGAYKDAHNRILEPYYTKGVTLLGEKQYSKAIEAFEKCNEYSDSKDRINEAYQQIGLLQYSEGDYDSAISNLEKSGNYNGSSELVTEVTFEKAVSLGDNKDYLGAIAILETIPNYIFVAEKMKEYRYCAGRDFMKVKYLDKAIPYFIGAGDYLDASILLQQTYSMKVLQLIEKGNYDEAYRVVNEAKVFDVEIEDYAVASPYDSNPNAIYVIRIAKEMGFIKKTIKDIVGYPDTFINEITTMESALGLEADGIIHLYEMIVLSNTLYPGCKKTNVIKVMEQLKDLGYLSAKLPDSHNIYEKKYTTDVKKAEKALDLSADGLITPDEQTIILKQAASKPDQVKKVTVKSSSGTVSLSWSIAKGAIFYDLYRNNTLIATVTGTSYSDKNAKMAQFHSYYIVARNYSQSSPVTHTELVYVEIVYKTVRASDLVHDYSSYKGKYVKVAGLRIAYSSFEGKDLYVLAKSGISYIYVLFEDYYTWDWDDDSISFVGNSRITSFWARGITTETRNSMFGYIPVINADHVNYSY